MATIASLDVRMGVNSAPLRAGLDEAQRRSQRFVRNQQTTFQRLNRTFSNLRGGFLAFAAALGAGQILRSTDELIKLTDQTELSFDAFQRLSFALGQTGVSAQAFSTALVRQARIVLDYERGLSTAVDAFTELGLSFEQINSLNQAERFFTILEALRGVEEESRRTALAAIIFGRSAGPALATALEESNASLVELGNNIETIAEVDARAIEEFNDNVQQLGVAFRRLFTSLGPLISVFSNFINLVARGIDLIPGISFAVGTALTGALILLARRGILAVVEGLRVLFPALTTAQAASIAYGGTINGVLSPGMARLAFRTADAAARFVPFTAALRVTTRVATAASAGLRIFGAALRFAFGPIGLLILAVEGLIFAFQVGFTNALRIFANFFIDTFNGLARIINSFLGTSIEEFERFNVTIEGTAEGVNDLAAAINNVETATRQSTTGLRFLESAFGFTASQAAADRLVVRIGEVSQAEVDRLRALDEANILYQEGLITLEQLRSAVIQINEEFEAIENPISELGMTIQTQIGDALADAFERGSFSVRDFARQAIAAFIRIQATQAAASIGSSNIFSSIFGGARQQGGPVQAGQAYLVGEAGPELFVPSASGEVVSNDNLGGGANVTYNINAIDPRSFRELLARDPQFVDAVVRRGERARGIR